MKIRFFSSLSIFLFLVFSKNAFSQSTDKGKDESIGISLQYCINVPKIPLGFSFIYYLNHNIYGYVDVKFGIGDEIFGQDYSSIETIQSLETKFNDPIIGDKNGGWLGGNLGAALKINKIIYPYFAIGYSSNTIYRQYFDQSLILSPDGYYYVENPYKSFSGINLASGIVFTLQYHLSIQLGVDLKPFGFVGGLGFYL